jgi:hypothetical protein
VPAFAEDAAQHFWEGKLAVGSFVADGSGNPCGGLADPALMTGWAEVAGFAGECEELFVAAIRALEAGKTCGEVATPEKSADGVDGILTERPHGGAVVHLVGGNQGIPCVVDDLPEGRCARAAWMVDRGRHGIRGWGVMSAPGGSWVVLGVRRAAGSCAGLMARKAGGPGMSAVGGKLARFSGGTPAPCDIFKLLHPC